MQSIPTWKRPERWLAFFITFLGLCSFLAIIPAPEPKLLDGLAGRPMANGQFLESLRAASDLQLARAHWTSLLPPLIAVMVAIYFRTMVHALLAAFATGAILSFGLNPVQATVLALHDFVWVRASSPFSLYVFLFLFSLVGLAHVISRNGGMDGLVDRLAVWANTPRKARVAIALAGLLFFFDAYSSSVVLGNTMRRLSDRWKISREKLAYLIDSTTAPVASLAILSTWVAFEATILGNEAARLGIGKSGYAIFIEMMPMRFYCVGTLIFLFLNSSVGRDFGPMRLAEERAAKTGKLLADDSALLGIQPSRSSDPDAETPRRCLNAVLPVMVVVLGIVFGILMLGRSRMGTAGEAFSYGDLSDWQRAFELAVQGSVEELGVGVMPVLFFASVLGGAVAILLSVSQRLLTFRAATAAYVKGLPTMWMAIFILVMTWSMQEICHNLGTADYIMLMLGDRMPMWSIPIFTFLVAAGVSFATGASWGTMGLLAPTILPLAYGATALEPGSEYIFYLCAAAMLDGAIFGDHCSPISDTTVLTSISTGCDHIAHVGTQLAYAGTTVALVGFFGYFLVGYGAPVWAFYALFPLSAFAILRIFGKTV